MITEKIDRFCPCTFDNIKFYIAEVIKRGCEHLIKKHSVVSGSSLPKSVMRNVFYPREHLMN